MAQAIPIDQLQLRETALRNAVLENGGMPLKYENGFEVWAVGDPGAPLTITIPSVDQLVLAGDSTAAAAFMNTLTVSEERLGLWLRRDANGEVKEAFELTSA